MKKTDINILVEKVGIEFIILTINSAAKTTPGSSGIFFDRLRHTECCRLLERTSSAENKGV